jgi:hypothetical protein
MLKRKQARRADRAAGRGRGTGEGDQSHGCAAAIDCCREAGARRSGENRRAEEASQGGAEGELTRNAPILGEPKFTSGITALLLRSSMSTGCEFIHRNYPHPSRQYPGQRAKYLVISRRYKASELGPNCLLIQ